MQTMNRSGFHLPFLMILSLAGLGLGVVGCDDIRRTETGSVLLTPGEFVIPKLAAGESVEREVVLKNVGAGTLRVINLEGAFPNEFDLYWRRGMSVRDSASELKTGRTDSQKQSTSRLKRR